MPCLAWSLPWRPKCCPIMPLSPSINQCPPQTSFPPSLDLSISASSVRERGALFFLPSFVQLMHLHPYLTPPHPHKPQEARGETGACWRACRAKRERRTPHTPRSDQRGFGECMRAGGWWESKEREEEEVSEGGCVVIPTVQNLGSVRGRAWRAVKL